MSGPASSVRHAARSALTHWRVKALLQKALSSLPGGPQLNYVLQRRVTHGIPISEARLLESVDNARAHLDAYLRHASPPAPVAEAVFYEFGAGWDLHLPLTLFGLGVRHQIVVDRTPHTRAELVDDVVARLSSTTALDDGERAGIRHAAAGTAATTDVGGKVSAFGITYRAPADARATGLPDASVDCVTSTSTFEHIPGEDIGPVLVECRRILRPGGVASFLIDYSDHYSHLDHSITPYNFLGYPEQRWRLFNSSLQFQNRLRHSQYLAVFGEAGFDVVEDRPTVSDAGVAALRSVRLDPSFARFDERDLATTAAHVVLRPLS